MVVPRDTLLSIPVEVTIVATLVFELVHVPPGVASLSCVLLPRHRFVAPVIGSTAFTVNVIVAMQPAGVV